MAQAKWKGRGNPKPACCRTSYCCDGASRKNTASPGSHKRTNGRPSGNLCCGYDTHCRTNPPSLSGIVARAGAAHHKSQLGRPSCGRCSCSGTVGTPTVPMLSPARVRRRALPFSQPLPDLAPPLPRHLLPCTPWYTSRWYSARPLPPLPPAGCCRDTDSAMASPCMCCMAKECPGHGTLDVHASWLSCQGVWCRTRTMSTELVWASPSPWALAPPGRGRLDVHASWLSCEGVWWRTRTMSTELVWASPPPWALAPASCRSQHAYPPVIGLSLIHI